MTPVLVITFALLATVLAAPQIDVQNENKAVDPSDITYFLYTRGHIDSPMQIVIGDLQGSDWIPYKKTHLIVHSHDQSSNDQYIKDMKLKFLTAYDSNVILVDWKGPAGGIYGNSQQRTRPVGELIGTFISFLGSLGSKMSDFHCIGFGLGAHACGFAGKVQQVNMKIGRISGLDPAQENFNYNNVEERLHESDADFVDVVHSCGGWMSFLKPMGHADFYPNNGESSQPGCGVEVISGDCSHNRAYMYFTESITTDKFYSFKCDSWKDFQNDVCAGNERVSMGDKCPTTAHGTYYLETWGRAPFAMG